MAAVPRFFVTGTDTGVGKTEVSAALLSLLADRGLRPFAFKPCESGEGDDSQMLWEAAGRSQPRETVCLYRFRAPLAPALAARTEGQSIEWRRLLSGFRALGQGAGVVEGAGGLLVPIDYRHDVIDLIAALKLPVLLVARAGLGTVNHTALSLAALRARRLPLAAVLLMEAREVVDPSVPLNRPELERRFPRVPFLGPVGFEVDPGRRRKLIQKALGQLLTAPIQRMDTEKVPRPSLMCRP